ncbi:hypothetical protein [Campylobacter sp. RM12637]|uniref:hypothetical protein n=1 Tax=Campylobacter sp. RM12637 TaxID=2735734 RepID=UPI0030146F81|nr:hypothetical protein [Campylobacter sp. RM12637]
MAGYDWAAGMSNNAVKCYEDNIMPKSKWNKVNILKALSQFDDYEVFKFLLEKVITFSSFKEATLRYHSYHHTSKYFNATSFYELDFFYFRFHIEQLIPKNKKANTILKELINLINNDDLSLLTTLKNENINNKAILNFAYGNSTLKTDYETFIQIKNILKLSDEEIKYLNKEFKVDIIDFSVLHKQNYELFLSTHFSNNFYCEYHIQNILNNNIDDFLTFFKGDLKSFCSSCFDDFFANRITNKDKIIELFKKCGFNELINDFNEKYKLMQELAILSNDYESLKNDETYYDKVLSFLDKNKKLYPYKTKSNFEYIRTKYIIDYCEIKRKLPFLDFNIHNFEDSYTNDLFILLTKQCKYFLNPTPNKKEILELEWLELIKYTSKSILKLDKRLATKEFLAKAYLVREYTSLYFYKFDFDGNEIIQYANENLKKGV